MIGRLPREVASYLETVEPGSVVGIEPVDAVSPGLQPSKLACFTDAQTQVVYRIHFAQSAISHVVIDLNALVVSKTIGRFEEFGILDREAYWLRGLGTSGVTPILLSGKAPTLRVRYVGEPVPRYNLPADWQGQAETILAALSAVGCWHNDIKCDNLTVLDGKLHLLDFGWATSEGEAIPADWPQGIGRQHRLGIHQFDDRHAIFAALDSAERDAVDRSIVMPATA